MKIIENTKIKSKFEVGKLYRTRSYQGLLHSPATVKVINIEEEMISYVYIEGINRNETFKRPPKEFERCIHLDGE